MRLHRQAGVVLAAVLAVTVALAWGCHKNTRRSAGPVYWFNSAAAAMPPAPDTSYPADNGEAPPPPPRYPAATGTAAPLPSQDLPALATPVAPRVPYSETAPSEGEVQTRGPVHEAFAEPVEYNPTAGMVVPREPPAPIAEVVPDARPVGAAPVWIPGYWAWDDDRQDFIWVSGIWRVPPPDTRWVPGCWVRVSEGWQWVAGYWLANTVREVPYLPLPPASLETGPSSPPPSDDCVWIAGCWVREMNQYAWRPGFWEVGRLHWVWVPTHYVWTPRGCVLVEGYWDRPMEERGLLFAPVYFEHPIYIQPTFSYSPSVVVEIPALLASLFSRPQGHHFYFGDYFEPRYREVGVYPWYECRDRREWYDPVFVHEEWRHRHDEPDWIVHVRTDYERRLLDRDARPARTLAALQAQVKRLPQAERETVAIARPLTEWAAGQARPVKVQKVEPALRLEPSNRGNEPVAPRSLGLSAAAVAPARPGTAPEGAPRPLERPREPSLKHGDETRWPVGPTQPRPETRPSAPRAEPPWSARQTDGLKGTPATAMPTADVKRGADPVRPPLRAKPTPEIARQGLAAKAPADLAKPPKDQKGQSGPPSRRPADKPERVGPPGPGRAAQTIGGSSGSPAAVRKAPEPPQPPNRAEPARPGAAVKKAADPAVNGVRPPRSPVAPPPQAQDKRLQPRADAPNPRPPSQIEAKKAAADPGRPQGGPRAQGKDKDGKNH